MRRPYGLLLTLSVFAFGCGPEDPLLQPPEPEPAVAWVAASLPLTTGYVVGLTATERGDLYVISEATGSNDPSLHRWRNSMWEPVIPPDDVSRLEFKFASGGLGSDLLAEGYISGQPGDSQPSGNHLLRAAGGGPPVRIPRTPTYSSGSLHGFASNGSGVLLLVEDRRLHRSIDGGTTWTRTTAIDGFAPAGPVVFTEEQTAFMNVSDGGGSAYAQWRLLRSTDAGETWEPALSHPEWFYTVRRGPARRLLAFSKTALFMSSDEGATWTSVPLPTSDGDIVTAAVTPAGGVILVLLQPREGTSPTYTNSVYYSPDHGLTWTEAASGLITTGPDATLNGITLPWYAGYNETLVRNAAGFYYILLHRQEYGHGEPFLYRTTESIP